MYTWKAVFAVLLLFGSSFAVSGNWSFVDGIQPLQKPAAWKLVGAAPLDHEIKLTFAIKMRNVDALLHRLNIIANPLKKDYNNLMTRQEIIDLTSPTEHSVSEILKWLISQEVRNFTVSEDRGYITAFLPTSVAQKLVNAPFFTYHHPERYFPSYMLSYDTSGRTLVRSLGPYCAPAHIAPKLDFITGSLGLPKMMRKEIKPLQDRSPNVAINPQIIRERYNISRTAVGGNPKNSQGTVEFLDNFYSPKDIEDFFTLFWNEKDYNTAVKQVIGPNNREAPTTQASVDLEYLMGVAPNITTWVYVNTGSDFWSDLTEWVNQLLNTEKIPLVQTMTYGNEGEGPSQSYRDRISVEFGKLGARGTSIIVAAGDYGTGCYLCVYFEPSFPATSPWVTSVGATRFLEGKIGIEASPFEFSSGGGFSWNFEQPTWQTNLVTHYFVTQKTVPSSIYFNRDGRGFPDISCIGVDYQVVSGGLALQYYGTSAAATTAGAIFSLLNEIRLSHSLPPLGFLNMWLYQLSSAYPNSFSDITEGDNGQSCCGSLGEKFYAASGWDPVSGLGSPNYEVLSKLVKEKYVGMRN